MNASVIASTYTRSRDLPRKGMIYWRVHSDGPNPSYWSDVFGFTSANPPSVPSLLAPTDGATLSIYTPTLDWNDPTNADHYQVQIASTSTFAAGSIGVDDTSTSPTPSSYTPSTALAANSTFYWRVRVYNAGEQYSNWSSVRHFHTKLPAPELVSPANTLPASTRPTFDWSNVNGATGYGVQVSTSPTFSSYTINTTVSGSSYTPTINLSLGKKYYWRVYAKGTYFSPWSVVWYFTT